MVVWHEVEESKRGFEFGKNLTAPEADPPVEPVPNPLEEYFDSHTTGPGIWKWRHYFEIYHRHFAKFVGREVDLLEIGVLHGGSLGMWHHYFGPGCRVYGVDIESDCLAYEDEKTRIFVGDQADPAFWAEFVAEVPAVDILIDDGGHEPEQQIASLEAMFEHIRPGGVYLCEDAHGQHNPFQGYISGLSRNLHKMGGPTDFQRTVHSVHLYPFVTVIEKRAPQLTELSAERRGTE